MLKEACVSANVVENIMVLEDRAMFEVYASNHDMNHNSKPMLFIRQDKESAEKTASLLRECGYKCVEIIDRRIMCHV